MGACNFQRMRNFVLVARDTDGCYEEDFFNDDLYDLFVDEMKVAVEALNDSLIFHKITVVSGYYDGLQYLVECEHELDKYNYDNEDCRYYFDMCRSAAYRKYGAEIKKINKKLQKVAKIHDYHVLSLSGVFSNGTGVYSIVG